jgi:hypothetical protein
VSTVIIHLDRSDLDLLLALREITALDYVMQLLDRVRSELPVLAPLNDLAVLSLFSLLPPEVIAAYPSEPVELDTDGVTYALVAGHQAVADARATGVARLRASAPDSSGQRHPVWLTLTPNGFTVEPVVLPAPRGA